ncbi:hypothetical protein O181_027528 [Austropuccinia psidii MF-1]|uniref:Uncharacterized protein n=1 Tax=Austropuccinia psidii MF-1 TaxID=1389203 RepID=A0A9Q3CS00_9BASI|nr:hypothetical protein [Austropuccinia psidii MF-1]
MSPVHLRNLGVPRNQPEEREGLSRTRRPGRGHLGHSGGWKDIEENHTHCAIHFQVQQKPQTRGLEGYGSSSSAPPTPKRSFSMDHGKQEVKPRLPLGRTWRMLPEDWNTTRQFRLLEERATRIRENQATIQAVEEQLNQTGPILIPSGSQEVYQTSFPVASQHSNTKRSVAKSHHSSQFQVVPRRRQGYKHKNKTSFNQMKQESAPMIQKLLDLVKEVHKSQK